jgi:peptidoglycan hydrolase-like protein with peptidoglycan-binding domain
LHAQALTFRSKYVKNIPLMRGKSQNYKLLFDRGYFLEVFLLPLRPMIFGLLFALFQSGEAISCSRGNPISLTDETCVKPIQEALIWTGHYSGLIDGHAGRGTWEGVRSYQNESGGQATGELSLAGFDTLISDGKRRKFGVGYIVAAVTESGVTLGLPLTLLTVRRRGTWGPLWEDHASSFVVGALHINDGRSLDEVLEKLRTAYPGRLIEYERRAGDWFVITGEDKSAHGFYVRLEGTPPNLKGFSVTFEKKHRSDYWPIVMAIASDFKPFILPADYAEPPLPPPTPQPQSPPPSQKTFQTAPTDRAPDCSDPRYSVMCMEG